MNPEQFLKPELINIYVMPWGIRLVLALAIFIIGHWVNNGVNRAMASGLMDRIKLAFDENDTSIHFPRRDVHLHNAT